MLRNVTLAHRHPVHGHLADAVVVHEGGHQDEHVENLMRLEPDITLAGEPSLGYPQGVEQCSQDVQKPHQDQPAQAGLRNLAEPSLHQDVVNGRNDAGQAEAHEDTRSQWSQIRLGELVPEGGDDRRDAQDDDHRKVDHFVLVVTIETVVQPWYERTHDEQRNPAVVQFGEQLADHFRVAAERVEREREAQAHDGPDEERQEDELLLELNFERGPRQEVGSHSDEHYAAEQMRPDVAGFGVDAKDGLEAGAERR